MVQRRRRGLFEQAAVVEVDRAHERRGRRVAVDVFEHQHRTALALVVDDLGHGSAIPQHLAGTRVVVNHQLMTGCQLFWAEVAEDDASSCQIGVERALG